MAGEIRAGGYVNRGKGWELIPTSEPEPEPEPKAAKPSRAKSAAKRSGGARSSKAAKG